jgi:signal transduction histidine kinase
VKLDRHTSVPSPAPALRECPSGTEDAAARAAREREGLARDLHDGLLQFLTGISLQVQILRRLADDPCRVREYLTRLHDHLTQAQRELRLYVEELRSPCPAVGVRDSAAAARIAMFGTLLAHQWNVDVHARVAHQLKPSPELEHELLCLMSEAVANGVRHGEARSISVEVRSRGDELEIEIADDGRGFGFRGSLDCAVLRRLHIVAPYSLCGRVEALGGCLTVHSTDAGTRLQILLPLSCAEPLPT